MSNLKNILAICGSTRQNSTNHNLINAIAALAKEKLSIILYDGIAGLPHFNPDNVDGNVPGTVIHFKQLLNNADGVIICTPEYAHGVPGTLKNAIDWTVATNEFSQKPTLLITASTDGTSGHTALLETLRVLEAKNIDRLQLLIRFARTKLNGDNIITDEKTLAAVIQGIDELIETINETAV
jgi:chromate reductase, NAD(P)H dehydrogenase (quinone)